MNEGFVNLIRRAREAVDRGDMYVGPLSEFPGDIVLASRMLEIPIGIFGGNVLLKLKKPRRALSRSGEIVNVVSMYDGYYYTMCGSRLREKDLAWVTDKDLPA